MIEQFLKPKFNKIISKDSDEKNTTRFTLEKLERGFGNTIGTAMRRVLLSSIPGAAVFAIEIKNVSHEFMPIPDVKEDAVELILNIKKLILEIEEKAIEEDSVFELKLTSTNGVVTAKDIQSPSEIKVINKDLVLAHTSKDKALDITFYVAYSKGYKTFEENRFLVTEKLADKRGIISIDSNFSPIQKVNVTVTEVNPGETKVFERLVIDVTTNGNILAEKAVAFAGAILKNNYVAFEEMHEVDMDKNFQEEKEEIVFDSQLQQTIESLNLSVRSENALTQANIRTVEELIDRTINDLKNIENLGEKSVSEIIEVVKEMGLSFKSE